MKKILIVEDELAYVKLLKDSLNHSYKVLDANDGQQGLALAKKEKPDLVLLDVRMPRMDGLTMLRELRKDAYGRQAKVILLTNLEANDKVVMQVTRDLPTYYFVKSDVALYDLLDKVRDLVQEPA